MSAEAAKAALAGVSGQGKEMARALMWLVDECISGVALELQQEARAGTLSLGGEACHVVRDAAAPEEPALEALKSEGLALRSPMYCDTRGDINDKPGYDCFGQPLVSISGDKSTETISCPNCGQKTGAARFAPHLQRCMGGGRNASTSRRSTTPNGNGNNGSGRNSAEPGTQRVGSGSKLARAPTPPVNSAFSAGAAGAVLSEKLRRKSASPTNRERAAGKDPSDKRGSSVATAKHQQALAIANAAVRGGMGADGSSPKVARTSQ